MLHLVHTLNLRNFFFDFTDYLFVILILSIFFSKKIIDNKMFIWISLCSLGPFFINHIFMEWWFMPDQTKYIRGAQKVRELNLEIFNRIDEVGKFTIIFPSIIFGLFPIPFIETINSIGFINKCLLGITTIYLFHKKVINKIAFFFINIWPSIFLYSSISLKDNLSLIFSILFMYFLHKGNYLLSLILIILIFPIKIINAFLYIFIFLTYFIFFGEDKVRKFNLFLLIILILFIAINLDYFLFMLNKYRIGFFEEANNSLKLYNYILFDISFFKILIFDIFKFLLSPLSNINSLASLLQFLENILMYSLLIKFFKRLYKRNKIKFIFWITSFFYSISLYSLLIYSDGTIARYKYVILIFFIFAIYIESKEYVKKIKL